LITFYRKIYIDNADLRTNQRVNCGPGPQVWWAVYPLVVPQVRILPVPYSARLILVFVWMQLICALPVALHIMQRQYLSDMSTGDVLSQTYGTRTETVN